MTQTLRHWKRGALIADVTGFFAGISLAALFLTPIANLIVHGTIRTNWIVLGCSVAVALLLGVVSLGIRKDRLRLALWAVAANAAIPVLFILAAVFHSMRTDASLGMLGGLAIYGFGSLQVILFWLAAREIRAEIARRITGSENHGAA